MTDGADCFCHIWPEIFSTSSLPAAAAVIEQISSLSNHQQCLQDIWWSIDLDWGIYWVDLMLHFLDPGPISHKYDRSDWYFDSGSALDRIELFWVTISDQKSCKRKSLSSHINLVVILEKKRLVGTAG